MGQENPCNRPTDGNSDKYLDPVDIADQYSEVFTTDGTELAATDVTGGQRQQPLTSLTSAEEEVEERADETWETNTDDSATTVCGFALNDDEDEINLTNVDDQAHVTDRCTITSDVEHT